MHDTAILVNTINSEMATLKKLWVRIQRYAAVDFQGWSKMTLKIKMAYISILKVGFKKFFDSHL